MKNHSTIHDELEDNNELEQIDSVLEGEVEEAIKRLKTMKSPEDNISAEMIQREGQCSTKLYINYVNKLKQKSHVLQIGAKLW